VTTSSLLGPSTSTAVADAGGHLVLTVGLGPSVPTVAAIGVPAPPPTVATVSITPA
jgi:hypothetical protein